MMNMNRNKKRNYEDSLLSLRNPNETFTKERKTLTVLEQKTVSEKAMEGEEFNEETLRLINAFKNQYAGETGANQGTEQIKDKTNPFLQPLKSSSNPFLPQTQTGMKNVEAPKTVNPFLFNQSFNFNFTQNICKGFEKEEEGNDDEEEDEGDYVNPEEEQEIKPTAETNSFPVVTIKYESEKHANYQVEQLCVYDFKAKAYKDKGRGKLSLELFRGKTNKGVIAFRANDGMPVLFQGSIVPNLTTIELSKKENSLTALIKNVITPEDEPKVKAIRVKFMSKKEQEGYILDFKEFIEVIQGKEKKSQKAKEAPIVVKAQEEKETPKDPVVVPLPKEDAVKPQAPTGKPSNLLKNNPFLDYLASTNNQSTVVFQAKEISTDQFQPSTSINPRSQPSIEEPKSLFNPFLMQQSKVTINPPIQSTSNQSKAVHISRFALKPKQPPK